jgi:hypothetical protein
MVKMATGERRWMTVDEDTLSALIASPHSTTGTHVLLLLLLSIPLQPRTPHIMRFVAQPR